MKRIFILIALLMTNMAFAQEAPQTLTCPLNNGATVKIDLEKKFFESDPDGRVSFFNSGGREYPIVKTICSGKFQPGYHGGMSCVGLTSGRIVKVAIDQDFAGGDIQSDIYVASVLVQEPSTIELISFAKKSPCTFK